jgi:hypothetical protein
MPKERQEREQGGFRVAPLWSLLPRPRSIFTLRPVYNTEPPPNDEREEEARRPQPRRRVWIAAIALSAAASAAAMAALWFYQQEPRKSDAPALVLVNGKCKAKETPAGNAERWDGSEVIVYIDSSVDSLGPGAPEAVETAFGTWLTSGAKVPHLRFETAAELPSGVGQDGKSSVTFAPIELPGHKNDLAITIGYADAETGRIIEADIVLNSNKHFSVLPAAAPEQGDEQEEHDDCGVYDVQNVATHEAGHFFGLDEDFSDTSATMFYKTGKCELEKRDLEPPDREVVSALYEHELATQDTGAGCGGASIVGEKRQPASGGFWAISGLLLAVGMRRSTEAKGGQRDG